MWDADSVPYTSSVMAAVVNQLGECRVQSVDVFATGATAAALCTGAAIDTPAGGVLRVDIGGGAASGSADAATSLAAHALKVAHAESSACTFVIVSSNPNAIPMLTALRALGRHAAAVTASTDPADAEATPVLQCTASIHLTLNAVAAGTHPDSTPSLRTVQTPTYPSTMPGGGTIPGSGGGGVADPREHSLDPEAQRLAIIICDPLVPAQMRQLLRRPLGELCVTLSSALDRAAEFNVARLQERMLLHPAEMCGGEDFPQEISSVPSLRFALVAGFAAESTWLRCEKAAVLEMLLNTEDWNLFAQIGCLAVAPDMVRLPPDRSTAARIISADSSNAAAGRALLAHMLHRCRGFSTLTQLYEDAACGGPAAGWAAGSMQPDAAQSRWLALAGCLDRISINWFARIRDHMRCEPEAWAAIENFPAALCKCDSFRRQTIATVGSPAVPVEQKRAIAEALLQYGEPGLFAQVAFLAKDPEAQQLPESIKLSEHINRDWALRSEGRELLESLAAS